jgi:hypothetical protein
MNASITNRVLESLLPPDVAAFIKAHILDPRSPFQQIFSQLLFYLRQATILLTPILDRALSTVGIELSGANIASTIAIAACVLTVLAVLDYVRRMVMWWTRFAFRIVFWAIAVGVAAWVWERGMMESAKDAVVVGGKLVGYAAGVKDVWMAEYERYEQQQHQSSMMGNGRGRSSGR